MIGTARITRIGHRAPELSEISKRGDPKVVGSNPTGPAVHQLVPQDGRIASYLWEIQKQGYKPETIQSHGQILRFLSKLCDVANPESVRVYLAQASVTLGRKENIANVYSKYAKLSGLVFDKPRYQREDTLPKIPLEQWLLDVINAARYVRHSTTLRGLFETGCRVGEWCSLTYKDFDFHRKVVRLSPEKGSKAREARLSDTLVGMVQQCLAKNQAHPFPNPRAVKKHLWRTTRYLASLHNQPGFLDIHAHVFRHYRACRLYWETRDILFVKEFLGHRSISSTMKYLQMVDMGGDEQYIVKATTDSQEAVKFLEQGFTYCNSMGDIALYRKRK